MHPPPQFTPLTEQVENVDNTHLAPYFPSKTLNVDSAKLPVPKNAQF